MSIIKKMFRLAVVASVGLVMVSCFKDKHSLASEGNMIPDNAVMAVKIDAHQIWDKALGAPGSQARSAWDMAKAAVPMYSSSMGELGTLAADIVKDPAVLGLRLEEPVVFSIAADNVDILKEEADMELYLAALLKDSEAFIKVVDAVVAQANAEARMGISKEASDKYTYYSCILEDGITFDMGVTRQSVVIRLKADTLDEGQGVHTDMTDLFKNGGPDSDGLEAFYKSKGDLVAWMDMEAVMDMTMPVLEQVDPAVLEQMKAYMPLYEGSSVVSDLCIRKGQTVLNFQMFGSKEMMAAARKYNASSSDKYFKYLPHNSVFVANFAMKNFAGMVEEISKANAEFAEGMEFLEEEFEINEAVLADFPGVVTFAVDGTQIDTRDVPGMTLVMECGSNVWDLVQTYLEMYGEMEGDVYNIMDVFQVAYRDGAIWAWNTKASNESDAFSKSSLAKNIAKGGFVFNLEALPEYLIDELAEEIDYNMTGEEFLEFVNSVVISSDPEKMASSITINMADKDENILAKIVGYAIDSAF